MMPQATLSDTGGDMVPQDILSGSEDGDTVLESTVSDPEDCRLETELDPSLPESEGRVSIIISDSFKRNLFKNKD